MHARVLGVCPSGERTIHTLTLVCPGDDLYPSIGRVVVVSVAGAVSTGEHGVNDVNDI